MYASSFPSPEARATQDAAAWAQHEDRLKKQQAVEAQRRALATYQKPQPLDRAQVIARENRKYAAGAQWQRAQELLAKYRRGEQLTYGEEYFLRTGVEYDAVDNASAIRASSRPDMRSWRWPGTQYFNEKKGVRVVGGKSTYADSPQPVNVENWAAGADANQLPEEMRQFFLDEVTNARATQNWDKVGSWMQGWKAATGQEPIRQQDRAQDRAAEVVMSQLGQPPKTGPYGMPDMEGSVLTGHSMGGGGAYFNVPKSAVELRKKRAEMEWLEMEMKKREMMRRMRDMDGDGVRQMLY